MDVFAWLDAAGRLLAHTLTVIGPLLVWRWTALLARPYRGRIGAIDPTVLASVMAGTAVLVVALPPATLTWDAVATVGGFWDLTRVQLLELAWGIMRRGVPALLATLRLDDARRNLQLWLILAAVIWCLRLAAAAPRGRLRLLAAELVLAAIGTVATIYAGPLLLWSVNHLHYWLFLLAILLIQDYRYDEPPLTTRVAGWLRARAPEPA